MIMKIAVDPNYTAPLMKTDLEPDSGSDKVLIADIATGEA